MYKRTQKNKVRWKKSQTTEKSNTNINLGGKKSQTSEIEQSN